MIQNEKESKLLIEGRRTGFWGGDGAGAEAGAETDVVGVGVVVQQPSAGLTEDMIMPAAAVQDEGVTRAVAERAAIKQGADELPSLSISASKAEAEPKSHNATTSHPPTDEPAAPSPTTPLIPLTPEQTTSTQPSTRPTTRLYSTESTTAMFDNQMISIPRLAPAESAESSTTMTAP